MVLSNAYIASKIRFMKRFILGEWREPTLKILLDRVLGYRYLSILPLSDEY
jgi:hypothetical protein